MRRPCFLVVDREFPGSISTRKLVIESAKLNVITVYDPEEAVEELKRFRNVDGVVFDSEMEGASCSELVERLRAVRRDVPLIVISPSAMAVCGGEAHYVDSHDPEKLLELLRSLCDEEAKRLAAKEEHAPKRESRREQSRAS